MNGNAFDLAVAVTQWTPPCNAEEEAIEEGFRHADALNFCNRSALQEEFPRMGRHQQKQRDELLFSTEIRSNSIQEHADYISEFALFHHRHSQVLILH